MDSKNDLTVEKESVSKRTDIKTAKIRSSESRNLSASIIFVTSVCVLLTAINIYELRRLENRREVVDSDVPFTVESSCSKIDDEEDSRPVFWVYGRNVDSGYLKHVYLVLERLGFKRGNNASDWDLLWAHDYPFRNIQLNRLKPHQKVNHFPGCGYITNKVDLATSNIKSIPLSFKLPTEKEKLLKYASDNRDKVFIQKNNNHRGIKIENIEKLDLDSSGSFVQEFVNKPFLVDGYKFDIGVYTIITSIDPLRVYIYNGDVLFRYCPVKYYPFDSENLDKYVVGDDYLPTWEVPSLKYLYTDLGFSMKDSFDAYVRAQGKDPTIVWQRIDEAIREICLKKESEIAALLQKFRSKRNFFEMVRFDFIIDEDLNVYTMEANMSPNLSSAHYPPNQLLYEQIIYNLMSLVGLGSRLRKSSLAVRSHQEEAMLTADKNLVVYPETCSSDLCQDSCMTAECQLCLPCITPTTKQSLIQAYREHFNRGDCKRIFPPHIEVSKTESVKDLDDLTPENQLMYRWFQGKCLLDRSWC